MLGPCPRHAEQLSLALTDHRAGPSPRVRATRLATSRSSGRPIAGDRVWSGKMFLYPNEMVPLQIDLAIGDRRYLFGRSANPAAWSGVRLRSAWVQVLNRAVMGEWSDPVMVLVTVGSSPRERSGGPLARPVPDWTLRMGSSRAREMRMWSISSRRPR